MATMREIKAVARKKRAKLLAQFKRMPKDTSIAEFAAKHGVTRARMSMQINKAREEFERYEKLKNFRI